MYTLLYVISGEDFDVNRKNIDALVWAFEGKMKEMKIDGVIKPVEITPQITGFETIIENTPLTEPELDQWLSDFSNKDFSVERSVSIEVDALSWANAVYGDHFQDCNLWVVNISIGKVPIRDREGYETGEFAKCIVSISGDGAPNEDHESYMEALFALPKFKSTFDRLSSILRSKRFVLEST